VRRRLDGVVEEADGRGEPGRRDGGAGGRRGREKGGGGRLGTHLTGGPHLSVAAWERGREAGAGGPAWAESGELGRRSIKKKREGRMGWAGVGKG
jgi:hypothetical protein